MRFFRPPYGASSAAVRDLAASCGYTDEILWSVDPTDWANPPVATVVARAEKAHAGSIIIMHVGPSVTPKALPRIIKYFRARGYQFVTVSQLIGSGTTF